VRKRIELQKKLAKRREEEARARGDAGLGGKTQEEVDAETAAIAAKVAADIEAKMEAEKAPVQPRERVVIGKKTLVTTEGKMSAEETLRIQAMCGAGKAGKVKAFAGLEGKKEVLDETRIDHDAVLVFTGCKDCEFNVESHCTKIFVESCTDFVLRVSGKVITQTVECNRLERSNLFIYSKIGTLVVEQSSKVNVVYGSKELFGGYVIWAGSFMLRIQVGENDLMRCDFGLTAQVDKTVNIERTQFKVWYNSLGKLTCDKIIRLKNGFPTTKLEDDEYERRKEANMAKLAERMGITIHRNTAGKLKDANTGEKLKPNSSCPCGSGKKYKKCCKT
jgi:hypothetical protein